MQLSSAVEDLLSNASGILLNKDMPNRQSLRMRQCLRRSGPLQTGPSPGRNI